MLGLGNILTKGGAILKFPNEYSFNFDGTNDYLSCGLMDITVHTNATMACWVKLDDFDATQFFGGSHNSKRWYFGITDGKKPYFGVADAYKSNGSALTINAGEWNHFALVADGGTATFYMNGIAKDTDTYTQASATNPDNPFLIGARNDGGTGAVSAVSPLDGCIDEFAIWNSALDATAIGKISSKVVDLTKYSASNLKLYLRCGDKAEPESTTSIARADYSVEFDGNDYVAISGTGLTLNDFSISGWFYHVDNGGSYQGIIGMQDTTENDYQVGLILQFYDDYLDAEGASVDGHLPKVTANTVGSGILQNSWNHFSYTVDRDGGSGGVKLYINGALATTDTAVDSATKANNIYIGAGYYGTAVQRFFGGSSISNIAIHQTALDAQTIKQFAKSRFTPMRDNRFSVVDFDGSDDYIETSGNVGISGSSARTLGLWFNPTAIDQNYYLIEWGGTGTTNGTCGFFLYQSKIFFYGWSSGDLDTGVAPLSEWQHLYATYDGTTVKVYLNGSLIASGARSLNTADTVLKIGMSQSVEFSGSISSVSIYDVAKTEQEIYALYQKGITYNESSENGLHAYYRMGDDTSKAYPTIADSSSNSNDGTIRNGASDDIQQQAVAMYDMGSYDNSTEELGGSELANASSGNFVGVSSNDWTAENGNITFSNNQMIFERSGGNNVAIASDGFWKTYNMKGATLLKMTADVDSSTTGGWNFNNISQDASTFATPQTDLIAGQTMTAYGFLPTASNNAKLRLMSTGSDGDKLVLNSFEVKEVLQSAVDDTKNAVIDVSNPVLGGEVNNLANALSPSNETDATTGLSSLDSNITSVSDVTYSGSYSIKFETDANAEWMSGPSGNFTVENGKCYKFSVTWKTASSSHSMKHLIGTSNSNGSYVNIEGVAGSTDWVTSDYYFITTSTTLNFRFAEFTGDSEIIMYIDNISIKKVQGNVGTPTSMDATNFPYTSILPDQSFLATGNSSPYNFIDFDGSDQYIDCGTGLCTQLGDNYSGGLTVSLWFKADLLAYGLFSLGTSFSSYTGMFTLRIHDNVVKWDLANQEYEKSSTLSTDTLYQVTAVLDTTSSDNAVNESNSILYINGQSDMNLDGSGTFPAVGAMHFSTGTAIKTIIGAYYALSHTFNGTIGQVAVWDKALSSSEVGAIYALGKNANLLDSYSEGLKGYWSMSSLDASTGVSDSISTIYDRSSNSNHGSPQNADAGDLKSPPNAEPEGYDIESTTRTTTTP